MKKSVFVCGIFTVAFVIVSGFSACDGGMQPKWKTADTAHTHQWGSWSVTTPATCTLKGVETRVCALDAAHKETRSIAIDPDAHDWLQLSGTAPTCTTAGSGTEKCQRCGTQKSGVLPALGHNFVNWTQTTAPTCIEEGEETGTCTRDATHKDTRPIAIDPDAHDWQQLSGTAPTCTTAGNGQRECTICAKQEILDVFPALGHNYVLVTTIAPTCTTTGSGTEECQRCRTQKSDVLPALGHNFVNWTQTTAPTCTTAGVETGTCTHDATHKDTRPIAIDPDAHNWQQLSGTAATCTTAGYGQRECTLCAKVETINVFPALGHNYAWVSTSPATCTIAGVETGTCTHDATHKDTRPITIDPNAHNWSNNWTVTTPPKTSQVGIETDTCTYNSAHTRTRPITAVTFTDIADLETYLSGLPGNTTAAAYTVKLNVNNLGGDVSNSGSVVAILRANSTKFVSLDLSGSTFTGIEDDAFNSCANLTGIILPSGITSVRTPLLTSTLWYSLLL